MQERVSDTLETDVLEPVDRVVVRVVAGEVTVTTGATTRVEVRRESGTEVEVSVRHGTLSVSQPDKRLSPLERFVRAVSGGQRQRCSVAIAAPPEATVDVVAVSAPVVVSGSQTGTHVKTVSGDITLSQIGNAVDVKTVSGDIEAKDIAGDMRLKTVSGDVAVVDGQCRKVDAKAVSGDVLLDLDLDAAGTYDISTVSGDVALRTTAEPDLHVEASTISGHLVTDFGIHWEDKPGRRHVRETIGEGGARLWVKTVSGDLRMLRGRQAAA